MHLIEELSKLKVSGIAVAKIERFAAKIGVDENKLLELYVKTKNIAGKERFAATPYSERILFLPQCLRAKECPAKLESHGYECQECGKCELPQVTRQALNLGYRNVFILPGGSIVAKIFAKARPKACLGIACLKELVLGSYVCEKFGIIAQGVPLLRDGCVNTDVDWKQVNTALHLQAPMKT
jgi:hypothetical protein